MTAEIGRFALMLALMIAAAQSVFPMLGAARRDQRLMTFAGAAARAQFVFVAMSFLLLAHAFAVSDYSLKIVAENSNAQMPLLYRLTGTWGNHEGSMLLWTLILASFGAAIASSEGTMPLTFRARVLSVQGMIGMGFLAYLLFASDPFERLVPAPSEGAGLNPLLEDPGLAFHPPFLYLGYVGFSTAFSFATAGLIEGGTSAAWARYARPWVLIAWTLLTIGIAGGSLWAYYELGWGGWWAWDPVENASLMPWLLGTALLHCVLVVERRQAFVNWALLLSIMTFTMSLVGTFVVRSGVLSSVHSFALDPTRGVFVLALILVSTGGALTLYALRSGAIGRGEGFGTVSREAGLLLNNVLIVTAMATVFIGTFYPLFIDLIGKDKISVGAPYYARTFVPLAVPLLAVMVLGPFLKWRRGGATEALRHTRPALIGAAAVMCAVLIASPDHSIAAALGFAMAAWIAIGSVMIFTRRVRLGQAPISESVRLALALPLTTHGVVVAHLGMGVLLAGITGATLWKQEAVIAMKPGESTEFAGYHVEMLKTEAGLGPNYQYQRAKFAAMRGQGGVLLAPELRFFPVRQSETTEAAISSGVLGNFLVNIGEQNGERWPVRLYYHPLVVWIWAGALMMALGGVVALPLRRSQRLVARVIAEALGHSPA